LGLSNGLKGIFENNLFEFNCLANYKPTRPGNKKPPEGGFSAISGFIPKITLF